MLGLRTLVLLKNAPTGVSITLFSDNVGNGYTALSTMIFAVNIHQSILRLKRPVGFIMTDLLCLIMVQKMKESSYVVRLLKMPVLE